MERSSGHKGVVYLVHGTFAQGAEWVHPSSALAKSVKAGLGSDVLIAPFKWSGANSHTARRAAGKKLAQTIHKFDHYNPDAPQYIVAHSHGGNVAAYALNESGVRSKITAVACLGTPFIKAHARDLVGAKRLVQWILTACAITILLIVISIINFGNDVSLKVLQDTQHMGPPFPDFMNDPNWFRITAIGSSLLASVGILWLLSRPVIWLWRFIIQNGLPKLKNTQSIIVNHLNARFEDTPVLIIDAKGDEAAWWLAMINWVGALPYRVWRPSGYLLAGILVLSMFAIALLLMDNQSKENNFSYLFILFVVLFGFIISTSIVASFGWILCLIWPAIFRSHALGFGYDDFLQNFIVEIRSSENPEQSTHLIKKTILVNGKGLHHSRLYQEESTFRIIPDWLNSERGR